MAKQSFLYLMERKTNISWQSALSGRREIKIGISVKPRRRKMTVDRGIRGKIILLNQWKIPNAATIESELHQEYKEWNFIPKKALRGSGKTEFFRLTKKQIRTIQRYLSDLEKKPRKKTAAVKTENDSLFIFHYFLFCMFVMILLKNILNH